MVTFIMICFLIGIFGYIYVYFQVIKRFVLGNSTIDNANNKQRITTAKEDKIVSISTYFAIGAILLFFVYGFLK